jgi:predicted transcriptional regulator
VALVKITAMNNTDRKNNLSRLKVKEAMRRLVVCIERDASIEKAIRYSIKYKANAILVTGAENEAVGVVSKSELMGAYYAEFPLDTPLEAIMVAPVLFCHMNDSLESALDLMRANRVHRLYVWDDVPERATGVLAYPDIVGLLYRYCRHCDRSIVKSKSMESEGDFADRFLVGEVMTPSVHSFREDETLIEVMEGLSSLYLAAVLIRDKAGRPVGVVSKSDLMLAYKHGVPSDTYAGSIMSQPVHMCHDKEPLLDAVQRMIFSDIHRLFVCKEPLQDVIGVVSLSDAARARSGSCRACVTSRISPGQ